MGVQGVKRCSQPRKPLPVEQPTIGIAATMPGAASRVLGRENGAV